MTDAKALRGNGVLQRLNDNEDIWVVLPSQRKYTWVTTGDRGKDIDNFFDDFGDPHLEDKGDQTMADVIDYCDARGVKFYARAA